MNRFTLLAMLLTVSWAAAGQNQDGENPDRKKFTLQQSIEYALANSNNLRNAVLDEKIADARVKETRGIGLPQVDASVGVTYNHKLQRFFQEYQVAQGFAGVNEDTNEPLLQIPGAAPTDVVAMQNIFQLKAAGDANVKVNQLLFNSSYLVGLQAANAYRDLAVKSSEATREQVIQDVSKAFYLVLINQDRIGLFEANIARVDSLLRTTAAMFENGFAESIDVDRIKVTLNNLKVQQSNFVRMQEVAMQLLKFQMNYPLEQPLEVDGDLASVNVETSVLNEYELNWDYSARSDYRVLEANRKLQSLNLKNKYAEGLPSLAAFANLGYLTQSTDISGIFKTNSSFNDNGRVGPDKWYSYSTFGVSLNVPIFSGLQRSFRVQQAKLELQKTDNNFRQLKKSIDLEIRQVAANYLNAAESAKAQKENAELAENIARVTKIKFEEGVGSNLEVVEAESALREAQINYYSALYDAIVAKIDLDKAYGKLAVIENEKK